MENILILEFLESFLGKGKKTSRGNYAFKCPNGCKADKYKLEININTNESGENSMKNFHQNKKVLRTLEQTVIFEVFCPTSSILDSESIKEVDY